MLNISNFSVKTISGLNAIKKKLNISNSVGTGQYTFSLTF